MDSSVSHERRNLVSARVPSHFKRSLTDIKTRSVSSYIPNHYVLKFASIKVSNQQVIGLSFSCNLSNIVNVNGKVKCTVVQALRLCTGRTAHKGSRGIGKGKVHRCTGTEALYRL